MKKRFITSVFVAIFLSGFVFAANPNPMALAKTIDNLKEAFKGESTASAKYAAYAKKAKQEGHNNIALLFEAASKSESIHANNHKAALQELGVKTDKVDPKFDVKSTKDNLQDAINGESYEVSTMYPEFLKTANDANVNIATISFNYAFQTEKKHKELYKNALNQLNNSNENSLAKQYSVCTTCGNTYDGPAPNRCGISMTPKERFVTIK
ncbi:MAG: ferritin family protein [Bacteroidota bacterium]|nr:ferritin family protein [Bacteroidota bacterium]